MTRETRTASRRRGGALAAALRRDDWERVALFVLLGIAEAARTAPPGAIDDVVALLAHEPEARDVRA